MDKNTSQKKIQLGTHTENYGSWMSNPVFYIIGGIFIVTLLFTILFFSLISVPVLGIISGILSAGLLVLLFLIAWVRKQYSSDGGDIMNKVHETVLSYLDYDGKGKLLEVGCGSGLLAIRAALTWPESEITGMDYWGSVYNYSKDLCENNAASEGVAERCKFVHGDARKLDFDDESIDAVISNYVFHNIHGSNKQDLMSESLRVLKKGGVFAINDSMKPKMYGNVELFAQKLRDAGYEEVKIINTSTEVFGSKKRAALLFLPDSTMIVGRK